MTLGSIIKSINGGEWRYLALLCVAVLLITAFPQALGEALAPEGKEFTGVRAVGTSDWFVYYSYIKQGSEGTLLFDNLYSPEPTMPTLNPIWLAVGWFDALTGLPVRHSFNIFRMMLVPVFLFVAYMVIAATFENRRHRKLAAFFLVAASGLGFFVAPVFINWPGNYDNNMVPMWPMDVWVNEFTTFMTLYSSPHFVYSTTSIVFIFLLTLCFVENRKTTYAITAGVVAYFLFLSHPFHILTIYGVSGCYIAIHMIRAKRIDWELAYLYGIMFFVSLPAVLYYLVLMSEDVVIRFKAMQNNTLTPNPLVTLLSFGVPLLLAVVAVWHLIKRKRISNAELLIVVWLAVAFLLIYSPLNYQRRMVQGSSIPIALLMTFGSVFLYHRIGWFKRNMPATVVAGSLLISSSNIYVVATDIQVYWQYPIHEVYADKKELEAFDFLSSLPRGQIVMNYSEAPVNFLPSFSGQRVYFGHGIETPIALDNYLAMHWFFRENRPEAIERHFLKSRNIDLLYYGPQERNTANSYSPEGKSYASKIYDNGAVQIYRVQ